MGVNPTREEITTLLELEARWRNMPNDSLDEQEERDRVEYSLEEAARNLIRPLAEAYLAGLDFKIGSWKRLMVLLKIFTRSKP